MNLQDIKIGRPALIRTVRPTYYVGRIKSTSDSGLLLTNVGVGIEGSPNLKKAKLKVVTVPWDRILAVVQEKDR